MDEIKNSSLQTCGPICFACGQVQGHLSTSETPLLMAWRCMYSTGQTQPFELKATDVCLHVKVRLSVLVQAYAYAFINLNIFKASPNFSEWERPSVR